MPDCINMNPVTFNPSRFRQSLPAARLFGIKQSFPIHTK